MKSAFVFLSNKSLFLSVLLVSSSFESLSNTKCVFAGRTNNGRAFIASSNKYEVNSGIIPSTEELSATEDTTDSLLSKLLNKPSKTLQSLVQTMSFQNYKYKKLIQSLSKQLIDLQRQIRLHKEEIKQLRTLLQNQKDAKRKRRSKAKTSSASSSSQEEEQQQQESPREDEVLTKEQIKQYQNEIQQLNVQIEKLLSIQDELQVLLSKEQDKLSQLEEENANYKRDITTLQHRITELQSLQKDTLDLVKVEREYYKKQIELVKQEVEKEKQKGVTAVEEEKQKMRKLVKALAAKEKEEKKKSKKG